MKYDPQNPDQDCRLWQLAANPAADPQEIIGLLQAGATPFYSGPCPEACGDPRYKPYEDCTAVQLLVRHGDRTEVYLDAMVATGHSPLTMLAYFEGCAHRFEVPQKVLDTVLSRCSEAQRPRAARQIASIGRTVPVRLEMPVDGDFILAFRQAA